MGNALCWRFKVNRSFSIFYCGCDEYAYEDEAEVVQVIWRRVVCRRIDASSAVEWDIVEYVTRLFYYLYTHDL